MAHALGFPVLCSRVTSRHSLIKKKKKSRGNHPNYLHPEFEIREYKPRVTLFSKQNTRKWAPAIARNAGPRGRLHRLGTCALSPHFPSGAGEAAGLSCSTSLRPEDARPEANDAGPGPTSPRVSVSGSGLCSYEGSQKPSPVDEWPRDGPPELPGRRLGTRSRTAAGRFHRP